MWWLKHRVQLTVRSSSYAYRLSTHYLLPLSVASTLLPVPLLLLLLLLLCITALGPPLGGLRKRALSEWNGAKWSMNEPRALGLREIP